MAELKTTYMGIELKNPLIVGACNLVTDIENLKKMEAAGAGAIVYKSLFEEQIQLENFEAEEDLNAYNERNAEMISLFPDMGVVGPQEFLQGLKEAKEILSIPVFASLNCVYKYTWVDYAKEIDFKEGLTISDLVIMSGGLTAYANPKDIRIFRNIS